MKTIFSPFFSIQQQLTLRIILLLLFWFSLFYRFINFYFLKLQLSFFPYLVVFIFFSLFFFLSKTNIDFFLEKIINKKFLNFFIKSREFLPFNKPSCLILAFFVFYKIEPCFFTYPSDAYAMKSLIILLSVLKTLIFFLFSVDRFFRLQILQEYKEHCYFFKKTHMVQVFGELESAMNVSKRLPYDTKTVLAAGAVVVAAVSADNSGFNAEQRSLKTLEEAREIVTNRIELYDKKLEFCEKKISNSPNSKMFFMSKEQIDTTLLKKAMDDSKMQPTTLGQFTLELEIAQKHKQECLNLRDAILIKKEEILETPDVLLGLKQLGSSVGFPKITVPYQSWRLKLAAEDLKLRQMTESRESGDLIASVLESFFF